MQIFRFPSFRLCPFYRTGINIGSNRPQHVLKHAEKQAETRRVQSFGAKFGASAAKSLASGELCAQPSSLKIHLKALMLLFRTHYKSLVGLFRRYCGLKFKHPIFGWNQIFPGQLKVNVLIMFLHSS